MRLVLRNAIGLLAALSLPVAALGAEPQGRGRIEGSIVTKEDGRSAAGAVLSAVHLNSGRVFRSEPASADGRCSLKDLPAGYYQFAIESGETLFAVRSSAQVTPGAREKLVFKLVKGSPQGLPDARGDQGILIAGLDRRATAMADLEGHENRRHSKTTLGLVIGGSALLLLLLLY